MAFRLDEFCDGDIAVAQINCNQQSNGLNSFIFASVYLDIKKQVVHHKFEKLVEYCSQNKLPLLSCLDSNSHSQLWGAPKNNNRGDKLESFLITNQLHVLNKGGTPTFRRHNCATFIDVTLCNALMIDVVSNWVVRGAIPTSD